MPNLTVRNIPDEDYAELQRDAKQNRLSINSQVLKLFAENAEMNRRRRKAARAMKRIDRIREQIAIRHPQQTDSVELIREDRDSR
jgi:hypothetical protein